MIFTKRFLITDGFRIHAVTRSAQSDFHDSKDLLSVFLARILLPLVVSWLCFLAENLVELMKTGDPPSEDEGDLAYPSNGISYTTDIDGIKWVSVSEKKFSSSGDASLDATSCGYSDLVLWPLLFHE